QRAQVGRTVLLRPREHLRAQLPIPLVVYGKLVAEGSDPASRGSVFWKAPQADPNTILALAPRDDFEKAVGPPGSPDGSSPVPVGVRPAPQAPEEWAAYAGYSAVVLLGTRPEELTEAQRRALEAYAATGGVVILGTPGRSVEQSF